MPKKIVCLGEIMLRLSPEGFNRFESASSFDAYYGGSESNVAISLSQFGHEVEFVTKLPNNELGNTAISMLNKFRIETRNIKRDGERIGIYFVENGTSIRSSKVIYDRKDSSFSSSKYSDFDFSTIFDNCNLFHISGITPALSSDTRELILEACKEAKKRNIKISYDFNYRANLWSKNDCEVFSKEIFKYVDILFGYIPDFSDLEDEEINHERLKKVIRQFCKDYDIKLWASTIRESESASDNSIYAIIYDGNDYIISSKYNVRITDRVGGGDAFTAGVLSEYLYGSELSYMINYGIAASAWKHTILGDYNLASREEIKKICAGDISGKIKR